MKKHIEDAKRQLTDVGTLAAQTESMERNILRRAEQRLAIVTADLAQIGAADAIADDAVAARYAELIEERSVLHEVIARARSELDP